MTTTTTLNAEAFRKLTRQIVQEQVKLIREAILDEAHDDFGPLFARAPQHHAPAAAQSAPAAEDDAPVSIAPESDEVGENGFGSTSKEPKIAPLDSKFKTPAPATEPGKVAVRKDKSELTNQQTTGFGKWLLRAYGKYIPSGITDPVAVVQWVKKDQSAKPPTLPQTWLRLVDMYKMSRSLRSNITGKGGGVQGAQIRNTIATTEDPGAKKPRTGAPNDYATPGGEMNAFNAIGAAIGIDAEGARKALKKTLEKIKQFAVVDTDGQGGYNHQGSSYSEVNFDVNQEYFADKVEEAADDYITFLTKAVVDAEQDKEDTGDFSPYDFIDVFNDVVLGKRASEPSEKELWAIHILADKISAGDPAGAKRLLLRDLVSDRDNIIVSFQNFVSTLFHPEMRGRKAGSKNVKGGEDSTESPTSAVA